MTQRAQASEESAARTLYDIAQVLESAEDSDARVVRVLTRLRALVPYERCAVLEASPGRAPRLFTLSETTEAERCELLSATTSLLARVLEERSQSGNIASGLGNYLAVPLVGLQTVVGVLFVQGSEMAYEERDVQRLSVVAATLAAYFSMLQAAARESERIRQLEQAQQAAEAASRAKDEFLALVSHELRTPLNTILAWADVLREKDVREADRLRALESIERSVRAEAKLVQDLLDLACIAKATLRLNLRAVDPGELIKNTLRSLRRRAAQKAIQIEALLDESSAPLIADPDRLGQIVLNLVTNAIKFTPQGGRIEVRLERKSGLARIQVTDSGVGITKDVLPHLFGPFRQADSSSTRPHGGLGVGLSLVKDLVELHGGKVRAESRGPNQGSTFTVELPTSDVGARAAEPASATLVAQGGALAGVRVLLVDDDRDICEVLQFVLEAQGAAVTIAGSAAEALGALELSMPDVLLSDLAMPGQSGFDLMRAIVAHSGPAAPPAAALSAYAPGANRERALASGFRMLLDKPISPDALVAAVLSLAGSPAARGGMRVNESGRR